MVVEHEEIVRGCRTRELVHGCRTRGTRARLQKTGNSCTVAEHGELVHGCRTRELVHGCRKWGTRARLLSQEQLRIQTTGMKLDK